MDFIDIVGLLFIGVMVVVGSFILILALSDKFDKLRGKKPGYGSFSEGDTSWVDIIGILFVIACPVLMLIYFS